MKKNEVIRVQRRAPLAAVAFLFACLGVPAPQASAQEAGTEMELSQYSETAPEHDTEESSPSNSESEDPPSTPEDEGDIQCGPEKTQVGRLTVPPQKPGPALEDALKAMKANCTFDTASDYCKARGYQIGFVPLIVQEDKFVIPFCLCPDRNKLNEAQSIRIPLPGAKPEKCVAFKDSLDQLCLDLKKQ